MAVFTLLPVSPRSSSIFIPLPPNLGWPARVTPLKKTQTLPLAPAIMTNSSSSKAGHLVYLPFPCCWFVWLALLQFTCPLAPLSTSHAQLHCCVWRTLFCCSQPWPLALAIFLLLLRWSPSLGWRGEGCDTDASLRAENLSLSFSALRSLLITAYHEQRLLWWELRDELIYGYNHGKSLGVGSILCQFSWIIVVGSPPEPMTCWHTFSDISRCLSSRWLRIWSNWQWRWAIIMTKWHQIQINELSKTVVWC